jgi:hypothetical protein
MFTTSRIIFIYRPYDGIFQKTLSLLEELQILHRTSLPKELYCCLKCSWCYVKWFWIFPFWMRSPDIWWEINICVGRMPVYWPYSSPYGYHVVRIGKQVDCCKRGWTGYRVCAVRAMAMWVLHVEKWRHGLTAHSGMSMSQGVPKVMVDIWLHIHAFASKADVYIRRNTMKQGRGKPPQKTLWK